MEACLASQEPDKTSLAWRVVDELAVYLVRAIEEVSHFYDVSTFLMTGTPMFGELGKALHHQVCQRLSEKTSDPETNVMMATLDPQYHAAIAASVNSRFSV